MAEAASYRRTFWRLLSFLKPYKWSLGVSIALAVGSQAAAVAIAFLTGGGLEEAVRSADRRTIWLYALAILGIGLVRSVLMMGRRLISGRQALAVEFDMRNGLYAKLQRLSFGFYDRHQTGQLMSRATVDLQSVRFFLGYGLIFFFQHVLTLVSATIVMFVVNWRLGLVAAAITPVLVVIAYRYSTVSHPVLRDVQQKMADVTTVAEESIVGVHVVKSFSQEERRAKRFADAADAVFEQTRAVITELVTRTLQNGTMIIANVAITAARKRRTTYEMMMRARRLRATPVQGRSGRSWRQVSAGTRGGVRGARATG